MKRIRIFLTTLLVFLTFLVTGCGGSKKTVVKTEPRQIQDGALERFPAKSETPAKDSGRQSPSSTTQEGSSEPQNVPVNDGPEVSVNDEPIVLKPIQDENIPTISIEKKTSPPEIKPEDLRLDGLTGGITAIIRDFGYTGTVEIPENFQRRVAYYIRYFSEHSKGSRFFRRAMNRGSNYLPMIKNVLQQKKLPLSLAYLPLIESGFNLNARSRAHAVGMWQFMRGTARMYGLEVDRSTDQRRDPIKSTEAAAEYLNDLLAMFGAEDPFLGISAYNAGEGKIMKSLRKISYTERSFWTLVKKNLLRNETDQYIPRLLAVVLMVNDPQKYTLASKDMLLQMKPEEEESEDLEILSTLHSSKDDLVNGSVVNTQEQEDETAAAEPSPASTQEEISPTVPPKRTMPMKNGAVSIYKVNKGDTLYSIARRFQVTAGLLKKWNKINRNRIYVGQTLTIKAGSKNTGADKPAASSREYRLTYTVNYTDSLARIALFFRGVSARDIMRWNKLRRSRIHPKQKLTLFLDKSPRKVLTHVVKQGENARSIARKYKMRLEFVLSLNGLLTNSRLAPGKRLRLYFF